MNQMAAFIEKQNQTGEGRVWLDTIYRVLDNMCDWGVAYGKSAKQAENRFYR